MKPPHAVEILDVRAILVGLRFRIDAGRSNRSDCIANILGAETAGRDHRVSAQARRCGG
jgi:hypothetical protein